MPDMTVTEALNSIKGNPAATKPFYEALQDKFLAFIESGENIDKVIAMADHPIWGRWLTKFTNQYCDEVQTTIVPSTPEHMALFKSLNSMSIDEIKALSGKNENSGSGTEQTNSD